MMKQSGRDSLIINGGIKDGHDSMPDKRVHISPSQITMLGTVTLKMEAAVLHCCRGGVTANALDRLKVRTNMR